MTATEPGVACEPDAAASAELERTLTVGADGAFDLQRALAHQFALEAIDRREVGRLMAWPPARPVAAILHAAGGTVMPAGGMAAADALAEAVIESGWRVLVGPAELGEAVLDALGRGLFRRRVVSREQRFMTAVQPVAMAAPAGLRLAEEADLDALTDMACRLHVEDRMGPTIPASGRASVRARLRHSVGHGRTWVVERRGTPIAKIDLALRSLRRGAQIAGVYVYPAWRRGGLGTAAIAALTRALLAEGLPGVTLHVRADNEPARAAYARAGYADQGPWTLALR